MINDAVYYHTFAETWLKRLADDVGKKHAMAYLGKDCSELGFINDNGITMDILYPGIMSDMDVLNEAVSKIPYIQLLGNALYSQLEHCRESGGETYFNRKWFISILKRIKDLSAEKVVPPNKMIINMIDSLRGKAVQNDFQKFFPNKSSLPEIRKMLDSGFDVNSQDDSGRTPLMYCAYSSENYVKELIARGADCSAADNDGNTVLMYLCDSFDLRAFDLVLKRGADINVKNNAGYSVLNFAVMQNISIRNFIERDARITGIALEKLPYIVAKDALDSDKLFAKLLKEKNILSADFIYALLLSFPDKWCDFMVKLFKSKLPKSTWDKLKRKLDNPIVAETVVSGCAMHLTNDGTELDFLLSLTGSSCQVCTSSYGELLKTAIGLKYHKALQMLLKRFGHPDAGVIMTSKGSIYGYSGEKTISPLMLAIQLKEVESVKMLLSYHADPNTADENGSALTYAIRENQMPILKQLLTFGADPNFTLSPELLPLKIARKYKRKEMITLLKEYGATDKDEDIEDDVDPVNTVIIPEFIIAGTFAVAKRSELPYTVNSGDRLRLFREPDNDYDKNAIRIEDENSRKLGYVPKEIARKLAGMIDKGASLWGKVIEVAKGKLEITALIYQRQIIPLDEMTGFTLTQGGGFQPFPPESYKYSLSVRKRKLECEITRAFTDIRHIEVNFDNAHWQEVWKKIQQCNFLAWQENYDIFACDAGEWDLTVRLKGGKKFHVRGTILYPEEWDMLFKLIHDLLNPFTTMGSGSFSVKQIPCK